MPAIVIAALANDLKPFMGAHRRLIVAVILFDQIVEVVVFGNSTASKASP
jgi:hypothetical protein